MTTPDDEHIERLRDAWARLPDAPAPLDADDEPADATTAAAVAWTRRAWDAQTAPPVVPDVDALVARRRDGPPAAPVAGEPPASAPVRLRDVAAAAALVLVTLGPAWWLLERAGSPAPIAVPTAATAPDAAPTRTTVVSDVTVTGRTDGGLELASGPVRLVLLDSMQ